MGMRAPGGRVAVWKGTVVAAMLAAAVPVRADDQPAPLPPPVADRAPSGRPAPLPPRAPTRGPVPMPPSTARPSTAPRPNSGGVVPSTGGSTRPRVDPTSPDFYGAVLGDTFSGPIVGDERVVYAVGGVGQPIWIRLPELELRCKGVVIWGTADQDKLMGTLRRRPATEQPGTDARTVLGPVIHAIYAEGDVFMARSGHTVEAQRLLIDFAQNRAYMVDGELHGTFDRSGRDALPLAVRAKVIRGTAESKYEAEDASLSTCSYEDPHYHFTTDSVTVDFSQPQAVFETAPWPALQADTLLGTDTTILTVPRVGGQAFDIAPLRNVTVEGSKRFGTAVEVLWGSKIRLADGREIGDWQVHTDYRSRRGWGLGADLELEGPDRGAGTETDWVRGSGYYQRDSAREDEFSERAFDGTARGETRNDRGRFRTRFRHHGGQGGMIPDGWRLDGEIAYYSDRGFLPEYYPQEAQTGKQQETYLRARRLWGNHGLSILASHRINDETSALRRRPGDILTTDYATQTDYLPRVEYHLVNEPIFTRGQTGFAPVNLSAQASVDYVKRRYDDVLARRLRRAFAGWRGEGTLRADIQARVTAPFMLGPIVVTPSLGGSAIGMDDRNGFLQTDRGGYEGRVGFHGGLRAGTTASREYPDVTSDVFGLAGLRHVVNIDAQYFNRFEASEDPFEFQTNDMNDELYEVETASLRLRNRLQTKDGSEMVDWLDYEARFLHFIDEFVQRKSLLGFREDLPTPLQRLDLTAQDKFAGRKRHGSAFHQHRLRMRLARSLWLAGELDYDIDRHDVETSAIGLQYRWNDRAQLYVGRRAIINDSRIFTVRGDARITDKWAVGLQTQQNTRSDNRLRTTATIYRRSHDYTIAIEFDSDDQVDNSSISFAFYPNLWFGTDDPFSRRRKLDYDALRWYR